MANGNGNGLNLLDIVEGLEEAGIPEKQAKTLARFFSQVAEQSAATKQDLEIVKNELKRDIKEMDYKIELVRKEIGSIGKSLKAGQGTQTVQIIGGVAALIAIFAFMVSMLNKTT